jgi:hypothetical protein
MMYQSMARESNSKATVGGGTEYSSWHSCEATKRAHTRSGSKRVHTMSQTLTSQVREVGIIEAIASFDNVNVP